jgi:putative Mn2+ efflux pump MntP
VNHLEITGIALALAMDAFAVAVAEGVVIRRLHIRHAFAVAAWFGGFQALMPLIGWFGGNTVYGFISGWDHWIAFGLLAAIGGKMVLEAFEIGELEKRTDAMSARLAFLLALATSLDALAVGFSFAMQKVAIFEPVIVIGGITFAMSFLGVWIGTRFGSFFEKKVEVVGGLVLIGIGLKVLLEHLLR